MQRPEASEFHPAYQKYVDLVPEGDYHEALARNTLETVEFFESLPTTKHDYRYDQGKWTVKEVLMHIIDTERVFSSRALAASRGDQSPVYRMDEQLYATNVDVTRRKLGDLIAEFKVVRSGTQFLFENLTEEQSIRPCNVVSHPMSTRAIGYFIIGHVQHHQQVLRERYLP